MAEIKDFNVEYITNGGSYHAFTAMVEDIEMAVGLAVDVERSPGRVVIPKACIRLKPPAGERQFNLMKNFRINDLHP